MLPALTGLLVLSLAAGCAGTGGARPGARRRGRAPAVTAERPRLLLRAGKTPPAISLRDLERVPRDDDFRVMFDRLARCRKASAQAMLYLLSGEKKYAEAALARMRAWKPPEKIGPFEVYFQLREMALAYDWLHDYPGFDETSRAELRRKAAPLLERGMKIGDDHIFHNYVWMSNCGAWLWALAISGDDPAAGAAVETLYARLRDGLIPGMEYLKGAPGESMWYWALYDFSPALQCFLAARSALSSDPAGLGRGRPEWLRRQFENVIACTRPDMKYVPFGDSKTGPDGGVTHEMAGMIAAATWLLDSPSGAHLGRWLAAKRGPKRYYGETGIFYFLYARSVKTRPAEPPLAALSGDGNGGHAFARSSWKPDATMIAFRCTDHFGDHNHFDQGSFTVYRDGELALDPRHYKKVRGPQQATRGHSTLLVDGAGQRPVRGQHFTRLDEFRANLKAGLHLETGDMTRFATVPGWTACTGSFAQAYPDGALARCVRQLLFVPPGVLLVVDRLAPGAGAPRGGRAITWQLMLAAEPKVSGRVASVTNGKSWLRCTPLLTAAGPAPTSTPGLAGSHRLACEYRLTGPTILAHLIEVGPGAAARGAPALRLKREGDVLTATVAGRTWRLGPVEVTGPGR
jgi:hypothetical protein